MRNGFLHFYIWYTIQYYSNTYTVYWKTYDSVKKISVLQTKQILISKNL